MDKKVEELRKALKQGGFVDSDINRMLANPEQIQGFNSNDISQILELAARGETHGFAQKKTAAGEGQGVGNILKKVAEEGSLLDKVTGNGSAGAKVAETAAAKNKKTIREEALKAIALETKPTKLRF